MRQIEHFGAPGPGRGELALVVHRLDSSRFTNGTPGVSREVIIQPRSGR